MFGKDLRAVLVIFSLGAPPPSALGLSFLSLPYRALVIRCTGSCGTALGSFTPLCHHSHYCPPPPCLLQGVGNQMHWELQNSTWVSAVAAVGASLLSAVILLPILRRRLQRHVQE